MKTEECAAMAQIDLIVRKLDFDKFQACTTATGVAVAPRLATAVMDGMWFFLGVQVDSFGLRPQAVRLLEFLVEDEPLHVLVADEQRRLLAASKGGPNRIFEALDRMQIAVEWNKEVGCGR